MLTGQTSITVSSPNSISSPLTVSLELSGGATRQHCLTESAARALLRQLQIELSARDDNPLPPAYLGAYGLFQSHYRYHWNKNAKAQRRLRPTLTQICGTSRLPLSSCKRYRRQFESDSRQFEADKSCPSRS